jgi:hypothetical protein
MHALQQFSRNGFEKVVRPSAPPLLLSHSDQLSRQRADAEAFGDAAAAADAAAALVVAGEERAVLEADLAQLQYFIAMDTLPTLGPGEEVAST